MDNLNRQVAERLLEVARILTEQGANVFRIQAYRRAADTIRHLGKPVSEIVKAEGLEGLDQLPGIGKNLSRSIYQLVVTGRLPMLQRLRGESDPVEILATAPGIGRIFAERIHEDLGIDTLEELEAAAYDGRLEQIEGFGEKRLAGIRDSLAARLGRIREPAQRNLSMEPPVSEILGVDEQYRSDAAADRLPVIAPRRFNPKGEAWLPILHTRRAQTHYTALFSNTARAHEFGKTQDWVVIYYDGGQGERQCTVITAPAGPLKGHRIVRGREEECRRLMERSLIQSY